MRIDQWLGKLLSPSWDSSVSAVPETLLRTNANSISGLWLPVVFLHESMDSKVWVYECIRCNGWHKRCNLNFVDPILHLWQENPICDPEVGGHEVRQLEHRS